MKLDGTLPPTAGVALDTEVAQGRGREAALERRAIAEAVKQLDLPQLQMPNRVLSISYDKVLGLNIVQIVDGDSGEVVQQLPGRDVIERAHFYKELERG